MSTTTPVSTGIAADIAIDAIERTAHEPQAVRRRFDFKQLPWHVLLAIGAIIMALPFIWMVLSSLKPLSEIFQVPPTLLPKDWTIEGYTTALTNANFALGFFNSFYIALTVVVVGVLTSAMAAYSFARIRFVGNGPLFMIFLATMMVPVQLTIIPLYVILSKIGWVDTHLSIIVPAALFNAFGVFLLRQYVRGIPVELEEAAAIDGASKARIFFQIIIPLLRTPMVALGIFTFLGQWNSFFYPLIFLNSEDKFTIQLLVAQFKGVYASDWGALMAAATLAAAPLLILFIVAQRQIVEGIALSGSKT
jgi:multiple sugar transport system permease protein